jgi:tricorn protease-like protein
MYVAGADGTVNVWARPIDGGPAWKVTNFGEGLIFRFATSPDGRWLALARGQALSDVVAIQRAE